MTRRRLRTWWRRAFRTATRPCRRCRTPTRLLRGTTAWNQQTCNTCARKTP